MIDLVEVQGVELFPAQELVGGVLPDDLASWPEPQRHRYHQLIAEGSSKDVAEQLIRDEYWIAVWGQ